MKPPSLASRELENATFACIPTCGFCCTFQPEASNRELALLRKRMGQVKVVSDGGRSYLGLHNKCGACTLLERRECQAYDLRPKHCRYFPFHVHFAETPEVYVNYTCRGVERHGVLDLSAPFRASVLDVASEDEWREHELAARETYGEFERRARRAGAWGDVAAATSRELGRGAAIFDDADLDFALAPFDAQDVAKRPFYLAPDLQWLTFAREDDALQLLEMDEKGNLDPRGRIDLDPRAPLPTPHRSALLPYVARLAARRAFAGSVYAIVDESAYESTVDEATRERFAQVAGDLTLRARILLATGVGVEDLAEETERFYDSTFLDAPTIGGWL